MGAVVESESCFSCTQKLCRFLGDEKGQHFRVSRSLGRGQRIEPCRGDCLKFWVLIRGTAAICESLPDGRRQISSIQRRGDTICGPMATADSPIWLEALDDCEICELNFTELAGALRRDPNFLTAMFGVLHARLEEASRHITTLGRLDSTERVILFLADTADAASPGTRVHLTMSREDIADYLGLNTETVSRIFSRLKKSGLFTFLSPTEYLVPDIGAVDRRLPVSRRKARDNPLDPPQRPGAPRQEKHA